MPGRATLRRGDNWRRRIAAEEREAQRQRNMFRPDVRLTPDRVTDLRGLPPQPQKPASTPLENFVHGMGQWFSPSPDEKHALGLEELRQMGRRSRLQRTTRMGGR
jgi:hypothetical protein